MKTTASTSILLTSLALAGTFASNLESPRLLVDKATLLQELKAWKESEAGQYAKQHGFIVTPKMGMMSEDQIEQDQLHRLYQTKLHIEEVQRANPEARFSIDSPFTLLTDEEFEAYVRKSYRRGPPVVFRGPSTVSAAEPLADASLFAQEKDWTTSGCVAAVKNQGQCGSCWAFASVAALESAYCLKGNELTTLSEQQLTSCDTASHGCEGGYPSDGLAFAQKNGGVCSDRDYPYSSGDSGQSGDCQSDCSPVAVAIQQVVSVPESEAGLLEAVSKTPVAVGVAAGNRTWKQYKGGVVSTCASTELDHAVVVVGFGGSGSATPFFKIRNSWGPSWGESGYIRLQRGVAGAGTCGIIGPKSVYPVL